MPILWEKTRHELIISYCGCYSLNNLEFFKYIKHISIFIYVDHHCHPDLIAQGLELDLNLRKVIMTLINKEVWLETLKIDIKDGPWPFYVNSMLQRQ